MEKIAVLVDSGSHIDSKKSKEFGVYLMPFYINLDGEFYKEQIDLKPDYLYNWIKKNEKLPKTSIPSPGELKEKFDEIRDDGFDKLIIITISKNFTGFFNMCSQIEYEDLEIVVIDSKSVALTTGLLAIYAKKLIEEGHSFDEIVSILEEKKKESKIFFTLDTFKYIVAGGRVPRAFGKVGDLLNIKPIVFCDPKDGKYHIVKTCRGEKKVIKEMEKLANNYLDKVDNYYMIISNGGYKKGSKVLENSLKKFKKKSSLFLTSQIAPSLGANTGPGLFGFGFLPID